MLCMECDDKKIGNGKWYAMIRDVAILFYQSMVHQDLLKSIRLEHNANAIHIEVLPNITEWIYDIAYTHVTERQSHTTNTRDVLTELILRFIKNEIPYKIIYCDECMNYTESAIYNSHILDTKEFIHNPIYYKTIIKSKVRPVILGERITIIGERPFNTNTFVKCVMDDSFYSGHMKEYNVDDYNITWSTP